MVSEQYFFFFLINDGKNERLKQNFCFSVDLMQIHLHVACSFKDLFKIFYNPFIISIYLATADKRLGSSNVFYL